MQLFYSRRQRVRPLLAFLAFIPYLGNAIDCSKGPLIVSSQEDADSLHDCVSPDNPNGTFWGDVVIATTATVDKLNFTRYGYINGSIIAQDNPFLQELFFDSEYAQDHSRTQGFSLKNLSRLTTFTIGSARSLLGDFIFQDLPALQTIDLNYVDAIYGKFILTDLPRLTAVLADDDFGMEVADEIRIHNVGLESINLWFRGSAFNTPSLIVDGVPNVKTLDFRQGAYGPYVVVVNGSGDLSMVFNALAQHPLRELFDPDLSVSGLSNLTRNRLADTRFEHYGRVNLTNLTVGAFKAINNTFATLPLDFDNLTSLHVVDNLKLESILFHPNASKYNWTEIVITGNPLLRLNSTTVPADSPFAALPWNGLSSTFTWPTRHTSTMVFQGAFDNGFFQPFVDLGTDGSKRPRVSNKFVVASSLGPEQFNCTKLNELRKSGVLKGEYSCQGQTVADESHAASYLRDPPRIGLGFTIVVMAVLGLLGGVSLA